MGKILWLASYPKSGNTWVRLFLANLIKGDGSNPVALSRIGEATLAEPGTAGFSLLDQRPWQEWSIEDIARMRPQVQERIAGTGEGVVPVKTHSAFVVVRGTPMINMGVTAGAVYVVRNPRCHMLTIRACRLTRSSPSWPQTCSRRRVMAPMCMKSWARGRSMLRAGPPVSAP